MISASPFCDGCGAHRLSAERSPEKQTWPEIDNVSPVKDADLIVHLEAELDAELTGGHAQRKLVMFTPSPRREEAAIADSYVFGR